MLHGCTQDAADIATGTRLDALADRAGFIAVYPEQSTEDNPRGCWNWISPHHQARDLGEPAIIAGITREVLDREATADRDRVWVTGLSAGATMAGILGATYPDLYAAVGIHSGLQYAAAPNLPAALIAMAIGGPDPERQGRLARLAMGERSRVVPVVVVHGDRDRTVRPKNGEQAVRQWLATNQLAGYDAGWDFTRPDSQRVEHTTGGLPAAVRCWADGKGRSVVEYWLVAGLGHAWSGGAVTGTHTDPRGPDATAVMHRFLSQHRLAEAPVRPGGVLSRRVPAGVARRVPAGVARRVPAGVARRVAARVPALLSRDGLPARVLSRVIGTLLHPVRAAQAVRHRLQPARRPRRRLRIRR